MKIKSPLDGLRISPDLVCEFFAAFSRFEFVLKEEGWIQRGKRDAAPDWDGFAADAAKWLKVEANSEMTTAISYLDENPPQVQTANLTWQKIDLAGRVPLERALHAVRRVRNNLFHGGKHTPHSPEGRDEQLVRHALCLLYGCLEQNQSMRTCYEQTSF